MTWSLEWWPWALRHESVDPFYTHLLWAPAGFPTLWMTSIPIPALLAAPLTLTAGPLVAYNALMLTAVVLAAAAAFLLCYELTGLAAPVLGGLVFGLSPYMLGHTLSQHLDLTFVFPVPLLALLCLRYVHGKTGPQFRGRFRRSAVDLDRIIPRALCRSLTLVVTVVALSARVRAFSHAASYKIRPLANRARVLSACARADRNPWPRPVARSGRKPAVSVRRRSAQCRHSHADDARRCSPFCTRNVGALRRQCGRARRVVAYLAGVSLPP